VNAADVLDEAHFEWACTGDSGTQPGPMQVAALLAHGEQGVAVTGDGTLWALAQGGKTRTGTAEWEPLYRLVALSAEAGDTDD
jgi:hypothetical protein